MEAIWTQRPINKQQKKKCYQKKKEILFPHTDKNQQNWDNKIEKKK